jgi:hypothetical protein
MVRSTRTASLFSALDTNTGLHDAILYSRRLIRSDAAGITAEMPTMSLVAVQRENGRGRVHIFKRHVVVFHGWTRDKDVTSCTLATAGGLGYQTIGTEDRGSLR